MSTPRMPPYWEPAASGPVSVSRSDGDAPFQISPLGDADPQ
jgi:hypothetical protein